MLEQAVYAGRNHTAILAALLTLLFAAPAEAADVARVALGQTIDELVAAPDGGAWISIIRPGQKRVGIASPDNAFRTVAVDDLGLFEPAALGPDGAAWFAAGRGFVRVDSAGATTPVPRDAFPSSGFATGADGTVWLVENDRLVRVTPAGAMTSAPLRVDGCKRVWARAMARASDGSMWVLDSACGLIRLAPDGRPTDTRVKVDGLPERLAADHAGGVWFAGQFGSGHVDAAGTVTLVKTKRVWYDVAVAPDGSAWFAGWRCRLLRVTATGEQALLPAPIAADRVDFDPGGGLWLASPARLVHNEPAGACDDTPPAVKVTPSFTTDRDGYGTVSLAGLRRARGFVVRFREPVSVEAFLVEPREEDPFTGASRIVTAERGATVRIPVGARRLRAWARRKKVDLELLIEAFDREGNHADLDVMLRVTE